MAESQEQGISRRDLLKRGAALGGAVVWATPVVQTLGMGRAYAQTASPTGQDISYIGINVENCDINGAPFFVKWEDGQGWEDSPGAAPTCLLLGDLPTGVSGSGKGFVIDNGPNSSCKNLWVPDDYLGCTVTVWVKAGQTCRTYTNTDLNFEDWTTVCSLV